MPLPGADRPDRGDRARRPHPRHRQDAAVAEHLAQPVLHRPVRARPAGAAVAARAVPAVAVLVPVQAGGVDPAAAVTCANPAVCRIIGSLFFPAGIRASARITPSLPVGICPERVDRPALRADDARDLPAEGRLSERLGLRLGVRGGTPSQPGQHRDRGCGSLHGSPQRSARPEHGRASAEAPLRRVAAIEHATDSFGRGAGGTLLKTRRPGTAGRRRGRRGKVGRAESSRPDVFAASGLEDSARPTRTRRYPAVTPT